MAHTLVEHGMPHLLPFLLHDQGSNFQSLGAQGRGILYPHHRRVFKRGSSRF
jgi:hypothetical protein